MAARRPAKSGNPHNVRNQTLEKALVVWKDSCVPGNQHVTFKELAERHDCSFQRIHEYLKYAVQYFKDNFTEYCEREKFRQVEQLEKLCETCWHAWERSQEPLEDEFRSKTSTPRRMPDGTVLTQDGRDVFAVIQDHQSKRRVKQNGDPRFLDIYLRAKADIRRLLGLDMPILVKVEDTSKISGMLARRYDDRQRKLAAARTEETKPVDPSGGNGDKPHHVN